MWAWFGSKRERHQSKKKITCCSFFILLLVLVYKLIVEYCIVYYDHHVFFPNFHVILWTIYVLHSLLDNITIFWGEMNSLCLWLILKHFHYVTITASVFFCEDDHQRKMISVEFWFFGGCHCRAALCDDKEGCPTTTCNILYWWWSWQNEIKHAQYIYFLYEFFKMLVMLLLLCYSI